MPSDNQLHKDHDFSFEQVPAHARKNFWPMFFIMLGFTFCSSSMSVGANLGNGLDFFGFAISVFAGGIILAIYTGLLGYIGCGTGLSFDLLARRSFGVAGSRLPSLLICLTQIGWFGVGVAMFSFPAAEALHVSPLVLIVASGFCMTASAYFGIRGMEIVSYISVPLILILGMYSIIQAMQAGGGMTAIFARSAGRITIFSAIGLVVGSFVSGGTTTPNFTRFAKEKKSAVFTTVIAFLIGNTLMFAFGAVGGAFTGKDDIFYVMIAQGLLLPALVVLGANIWTTNDNALYSGGLSLSNITGIRKRPLVIVSGIIGTAASGWMYNNFVSWLIFLNATLPPIGAIIILDYFWNPQHYRAGEEAFRGIHWGAVAGVIVGALAGNFIHAGITSINAMIVGCICYLLYEKAAR
ncbi:MAG: cytosine permease [Acidaminococcaceae bacterium]|nr:cytosine permease [Acidaminococcaceae bacterium]